MLTKEECLEALNYLASWQCVYCWKTHGAETDIEYQESKQLLKHLINEHFDNPALRLDELKIGMWVYDATINKYRRIVNIQENKLYFEGQKLGVNFKENKFYRKLVE